MPKKQNRAFDYSKYAQWIDPADCKPYEQNAKIHTEKQIKNICNSIKRFGWQQDTVLTRDNVLVIGHGRRLAAIELGCKLPFHYVDKTADELTEDDIRELRIADNQTNAETGIDFEILSVETEDLTFEGFDFDFVDATPEEPQEVVEDEVPEEVETRCKLGDKWKLGEHIAEKTKTFDRFELYPTTDRIRLEGFLIKMFNPKYNVSSGADYMFRSIGADSFPSLSIQEAIKKYDEYMGDPMISEIAEDIGTYQGALLKGLVKAGAPVYKIKDYFRLDKDWYKLHAKEIWNYVE